MQRYQSQTQYFKALMHPTRMAILDALREGEQCVCHMEAAFGLRQAHISQHLMVLRDAGLVADRRGRSAGCLNRRFCPKAITLRSMGALASEEAGLPAPG